MPSGHPRRPSAAARLPGTGILAAACLLAGCLFETRPPSTVPLRLDAGFARFDPLVASFIDDSGNVEDTLYRGPGGDWTRLLTVDGLDDSGTVRLEGYAGGRLAYRLDIPWPADTLLALPRWTPVGKPVSSSALSCLSLAFRAGQPIALAPTFPGALLEFYGSDWGWNDLDPVPRTDGGPSFHGCDELISEPGGVWLLNAGPPLMARRVEGSGWDAMLVDSTFGGYRKTVAYGNGTVVAAADDFSGNQSYVRVRHYEAEAGWTAAEKRLFMDYSLPYKASENTLTEPINPALVRQDGETALVLEKAEGTSSDPGMILFRRRNGIWDSTPEFPTVFAPSLAVQNGAVFMAFEERTADTLHGNWSDSRISLRRFGQAGWEDVGPRDIFGRTAWSPRVRIHRGIPYVGARDGLSAFLVARLKEGRWELLVQPRFSGFEHVFDFELDDAGTPYLAVSGESGTRIVKFIDPYLP